MIQSEAGLPGPAGRASGALRLPLSILVGALFIWGMVIVPCFAGFSLSTQGSPAPDCIVLLIEDAGGRILATVPLPDGHFSLRFIHSIHRTRVDEYYRTSGDVLELYELRYDTYGTGMPSGEEEGFRLEDGRFVVTLHRRFPSIELWVSPVPGHGLDVGDTVYDFTGWVLPETRIRLVPARLPECTKGD